MKKLPLTINVDQGTREHIAQVQALLTVGEMRPTMGDVAREALRIGLEALSKRGGK